MNATNGMIAGIYNGWIAKRTSSGFAAGTVADPENIAADTTTHAYRLKTTVSVGAPGTTRDRAIMRGGQKVWATRRLGISDIGEFPFVLAGLDETFDALIADHAVDTATNTGVVMTSPNVLLEVPPRFILGLSLGFTDEQGNDWYDTYIWNNVTITRAAGESGSQTGGENPNPLEYTVTPEASERTGVGLLYADTDLAVVDDNDLFIRLRARWQYTLSSYIADGTETTFTLGYLPKSSDPTGAAGNFITKGGTTTAVTSVATSTGLVTLTGAGSSGDHWQICYPTTYKAP